MANKTLSVKLNLDIKGFSKNLKLATKQLSASMKKMGATMKSAGKTMSIALTIPIVGAGVAMIKLASDAEETRNRFTSTMGDMTKSADKFVKSISDGVGRNKTEIMDGLSSFMQFGVGMGFTGDQAFDMSKKLQALSIDFASFNNLSDAEAQQRFIAGMSGSSEVFDKFGINIKSANLGLKLQELGLANSTAKATEAQKATARLAIIMETMGKQGAVGDAERTAGSFANVLKKFTSTVKTLGETMGKELIPMATQLLQKITPLVEGFTSLNPTTKRMILLFGGLVAVAGPIVFVLGSMVTAIGALLPVLGTLAGVFASVIVPMLLIGGAVVVVIGAWDDLVIAGETLWDNLYSIFDVGGTNILDLLLFPFQTGFKLIISAFNSMGAPAQDFVKNVIEILVNLPLELARLVVKPFVDTMNTMLETYNAIASFLKLKTIDIQPFKNFIPKVKIKFKDLEKIADIAFDSVAKAGKTAFGDIKLAGGEAMKRLGDRFEKGLDKMGLSTDKLKAKMDSLFQSMKQAPSLDMFATFSNKGFDGQSTATPSPFDGTGVSAIQTDSAGNKQSAENGTATVSPFEQFRKDAEVTEEEVQQGFIDVFNNISSAFADSMADMIVEGGSFKEVMESLWKDLTKQLIAMMIKMAIQFAVSQLLMTGAKKVSDVSKITGAGAVAFANGVASWAGAPWPINLGAPAFGASMQASALSALGSVALASGGITTGPTNALIGEAGQEAVIPLDKLDNIVGGKDQTIIVELDSRVLTQAVIKEFPQEVRLQTGVIM